jgi:hypothetical protein
VSQRHVLARDLKQLDAGSVAAAWACLLAGLGLSMLSWRAVLVDLGSSLPVPTAARIFFVGQLGKYLPGSVWPLLTQMQMGKDAGVPRARMGAGGLVALGLSVVSGLLVGLLALPALLSDGAGVVYAVAAVLLLVVGAVVLHPAVLNRVLALGLRVARRSPLETPLTGRGTVAATAFLLGCWLLYGAQMWLLVHAVGGRGASALPLSVGSFALASTLGLLFVIAPAGAGVREVVLVLGLSPVLSAGQATTVAVVSRLLVTLADAAAAGAALLVARLHAPAETGRRTATDVET